MNKSKNNLRHEIILWYSKEDGCYLAEVPELPECMADGESISEVTSEIERSIGLWIEVNTERGVAIPEPKGRLMPA